MLFYNTDLGVCFVVIYNQGKEKERGGVGVTHREDGACLLFASSQENCFHGGSGVLRMNVRSQGSFLVYCVEGQIAQVSQLKSCMESLS